MSYIDKNLLEQEQILYRTKKHWIIFAPAVFWAAITVFFFFNSNEYVHRFTFLPAFLGVIYLGNALLTHYFSEFAVTNIRIMMREGFFFKHMNDTRLSAIANVTANQDLIGQVLGYGTVYINSFGGESDPFRDIDNPMKFKNALQEQLYLNKK